MSDDAIAVADDNTAPASLQREVKMVSVTRPQELLSRLISGSDPIGLAFGAKLAGHYDQLVNAAAVVSAPLAARVGGEQWVQTSDDPAAVSARQVIAEQDAAITTLTEKFNARIAQLKAAQERAVSEALAGRQDSVSFTNEELDKAAVDYKSAAGSIAALVTAFGMLGDVLSEDDKKALAVPSLLAVRDGRKAGGGKGKSMEGQGTGTPKPRFDALDVSTDGVWTHVGKNTMDLARALNVNSDKSAVETIRDTLAQHSNGKIPAGMTEEFDLVIGESTYKIRATGYTAPVK